MLDGMPDILLGGLVAEGCVSQWVFCVLINVDVVVIIIVVVIIMMNA